MSRPALALLLLLAACSSRNGRGKPEEDGDVTKYAPAQSCEICHRRIFVQHRFSMHRRSFEDPLFLAQLYQDLAPAAQVDERLTKEADSCLGCHSPVTWLQAGKRLVPREEVKLELSGVSCDFCHTVTGFRGSTPGNANYVVKPGEPKYGSIPQESDWHHAYDPLQLRSEYCAMCHSAENTLGVETRTTYSEWQETDYAKRGVQCQGCHMSAAGFQVDGGSVYESGQAAVINTGATKEHTRLSSHRFPGAHSASQLHGSMGVTIRETNGRLTPGQKITIEVEVDNARAGHKMPSGSLELRLMWLEVKVGLSDDHLDDYPAATAADPAKPFDVAFASAWDKANLGDEVPRGARLYRAVFEDPNGEQALEAYRAAKKLFDNRLGAGERRVERFEYTVPYSLNEGDDLHVVASLKYRTAPAHYYERFELEPRPPVQLAVDMGRIGTPEGEGELRQSKPAPR